MTGEDSRSERTLLDLIQTAPLLPPRSHPLAMVEEHVIRFLDQAPDRAGLHALLRHDQRALQLVAGVALHAPFLARLMRAAPAGLLDSFQSDPDVRMTALADDMRTVAERAGDASAAMPDFRRIRNAAALHIALCDCGGVWGVEAVTSALTALADAAVRAALDVALATAARSGFLLGKEAGRAAAGTCGITVLAMGKHGAGELNYSSDIDLIVLFEPQDVPVAKGREPLDVVARITRDLVKLLQERTRDGQVFRVDLRLRPDPGSTPIALPIGQAFSYYETLGQNWERAALIKARPVAGDIGLGERFLAELQPFIWRRYFDYATIADIHAMKRQIQAFKGHERIAIEGHDIKLGRGGIREIEFFVQTQQLVFGGRRPELRGARTLEMLAMLASESWVSERARDDLTSAYRFLRTLEHRLQMVEDQQTQRLPKDADGVARIGRFLGLTPARFRRVLTGHLQRVERHYARLFEHAPELSSPVGNLVFTGVEDDPGTLATLRKLGFQRPSMVAETIRGWHFGRRPGTRTPRAREVLTELVPALLEALGGSGDPDGALIALDRALQRMPAAGELFTILKSNRALLQLFAQMLGTAPRLAEIVAARPHVLDAVIDPAFGEAVPDPAIVRERLCAAVSATADEEDFLDLLRYGARAENFVVGARMLSGVSPPLEAGQDYSAIADEVVALALARCEAAFTVRHGRLPGARLAVLALGRLGSRELTAASDLDLLVVYDGVEDAAASDGGKPLGVTEYMSRLVQRVVSALTVSTKAGSLYAVDLRLRPHGGKGPPATTLASFADYLGRDAETWELMALTRSRGIAGDPVLLDAMQRTIGAALACNRKPQMLKTAVVDMRKLVAKEKGLAEVWDMKLAPGGLTDLEFIAQWLILSSEGRIDVRGQPVAAAWERAAEEGMIGADRAAALSSAWRVQTSLFQLMRLCVSGDFRPREASKALTSRLARSVGEPGFARLEKRLQVERAGVVDAFTTLLGEHWSAVSTARDRPA